MHNLPAFTTIDTIYGKFIVNRHCHFHAEVLIKSGIPHIEEEIKKIQAILSTFPEDSVMLDVGANIGLISVPCAQTLAAKKGRVIAFEPQTPLAYALGGTCVLNDIDNLSVVNQGLGSKASTLSVNFPDYTKPQDLGLFALSAATTDSGDRVEVTTVDSLDLPALDFLKIDVEGMETEVLQGAKQTIERTNPWCWVEYWKVGLDTIKDSFVNLNYRFYRMDEWNLLCVPIDRSGIENVNINASEV